MSVSTSIDAKAGRLFTMKVSDGAPIPTFLLIGGLKGTKMQINAAPVDITNVMSDGWKEYLPGAGVKEMTLSGDGIFDSLTVGARKIWDAALAQDEGGYLELQIISGHGDSFVGTFVVENYGRDGTNEQAETFSISVKSSGKPTYIPAP